MHTREIPAHVGLNNGDKLSRQEFHDIYETYPDDFKAELISGIVYVSMPLKRQHASGTLSLGAIFEKYRAYTPGVEALDNATVFLSDKDEVQPDLVMRIMPKHGGQSKTTYDNYVDGAPEFIAEVAHSSRAIDLHRKLNRYARFGVVEYLVFCLWPKKIYWFNLQKSQSRSRVLDDDGIFKSNVFPGLWIQGDALLSADYELFIEVLDKGLASPAHATFVRKLKQNQSPE